MPTATYGAKFPKSVVKITDDREELLAFYSFSAERWIHLRTTNPIGSTFSTVKLRTKVARSAGSPAVSVRPESVKFWQGDKQRGHTRLVYLASPDGWAKQMLWP